MSYSGFGESPKWGVTSPPAQDRVRDAFRKEQILKDITAGQDDLRALLARIKGVEADVDKLTSENTTLQMYIDNLTVQMAKRR